MKKLATILGFVAVLLAGCESMSTRVQARFTPVPPHTKVFAADEKAVYYAAQTAVKKVGLMLGHSSIARWSIDGYAPSRSGDATSDTRQTTIEIRLTEANDGQTQVALLVWDHTEGRFPGGVSEQALRDHSLYETYFAALQEVLLENDALRPGAKP